MQARPPSVAPANPDKLPPSPYIFKSMTDGIFYLIAFLVLPLISVVTSIEEADSAILFTAFSCCFCAFYDAWSRYDSEAGRIKIIKLFIVGGVHLVLIATIYWDAQRLAKSQPLFFPHAYTLLATAPIFGLVDLMGIVRDDILSRK